LRLSERVLTISFSVSGASRGIGLQLVYNILERQPDAVIFAGARDPASAKELNEFAGKHSNVHVIKLIADDEESNKQAVEEIKKITDRLDVVVANAGKSDY
jgi:norsolorinic acid ketoreductase